MDHTITTLFTETEIHRRIDSNKQMEVPIPSQHSHCRAEGALLVQMRRLNGSTRRWQYSKRAHSLAQATRAMESAWRRGQAPARTLQAE